ncbi:protein KRI1 homolog [Leguminivora glycinivorella]|uniref:protein KRI1 homolog n=1 Tax=Leguminivora glycinivorella TaxID=1035111 RepID=UPI00200E4ED3|nr:protein KRI1 homolog [Leguminivora glycinivorella]
MPKKALFDEDSEEEVTLKTENEYAKKYDSWRQKEELHKLEQKYGPKALNSDASLSSDSEDDDDEPPEVSEETETQFLKTLALLKTKDPRIYDPNFKFFDKEKKDEGKKPEVKTLSFAESDDDDDDDGNIFKVEKAAEVTTTEKPSISGQTEKLKDFLTGKAEHINNPVERDLAPLKALWSDPKLNEGEAFLRDYILNKKYLEEGDAGEAGDKIRDDADLEADEAIVEEQGKFERAYNFRFEEPDEEYLKRFPRTMNYIRPKDDRRARKRAEVRERKEEEKKKKMDEIARMKALKLKEIQEKIAKIKEVTGNQELAFREEDMESDFDPNEHDKRMKEIFDEEYYGEVDSEKPVFPDLDEELEIENWEKYEDEETAENEPHCEDDEFNMDADYDPKQARLNLLEELQSNMTKKRRNRKKKSKLAELLTTEKPKFVPTVADKSYSQYMEEYYKMDCEDVIGGDLPTRFKYREVVPNDYGLTIEEILLADDKELTQWVPLKKIVKHQPANMEKGEVKVYRQKAADERLKKKILPSLFKDLPEEPEIVVPIEAAKKKKKKKKNKNKEGNTSNDNQEGIEPNESMTSDPDTLPTEANRKKKKHKGVEENVETENNSSDIANDNVLPKNKKNKNKSNVSNEIEGNISNVTEESENNSKKKKKKHKTEQNNTENNIDSVPVTSETKQNNQNLGSSIDKSSISENHSKKSKKKKKNKPVAEQNTQKQNLKRKLDDAPNNPVPQKKKKKKNKPASVNNSEKHQKGVFKKNKQSQSKTSDNPYSNLSDERLKAYGLNPKKYKGFMKYKKF